MNKFSLDKIQSIAKHSFGVFIAIFISACADTSIVALEDSVAQTNNLKDYDSDGVVKVRDKCDFTVIGASIDNDGCGTQTTKIEPFEIDIHFDNNSSLIPSIAYAEIKKLAEFLEEHKELEMLIEGHTSKVGSEKLNQALSDNRAKAVVFVLINDFNIASERLSSIGYGFERLAEDGDTEEAHAANRRIVGQLSHKEQVDELKWNIYTVDKAN
jgi:outer membrane protein OmpA-like peptidoglycan-associated protein